MVDNQVQTFIRESLYGLPLKLPMLLLIFVDIVLGCV
jgi:hypothetical protein